MSFRFHWRRYLIVLAPIFVIIFAFILFREPITKMKIASIILALAGCVLTSGILENNKSMHWTWIGILIRGAGAVFCALYSVFSKIGMKKIIRHLQLPFTVWAQLQSFCFRLLSGDILDIILL